MKYNIVKILIYLFAAIGFIEVTNLGFYLMNQPDSYLFYLGLTVVLFAGIFLGVEVLKILTYLYDKINNKKEDNQE
jgi:hypothetical protein